MKNVVDPVFPVLQFLAGFNRMDFGFDMCFDPITP
jgi:hypothetical protein